MTSNCRKGKVSTHIVQLKDGAAQKIKRTCGDKYGRWHGEIRPLRSSIVQDFILTDLKR